jgi:hypothetical protein
MRLAEEGLLTDRTDGVLLFHPLVDVFCSPHKRPEEFLNHTRIRKKARQEPQALQGQLHNPRARSRSAIAGRGDGNRVAGGIASEQSQGPLFRRLPRGLECRCLRRLMRRGEASDWRELGAESRSGLPLTRELQQTGAQKSRN